ncbi:MAG: FRG domain-containing protein [Candidatus Cloacimonadaceae bacterium]|nr:FRG domain-containing protein [Candidatus Cloacimonadaceae bacterium]
MSSITTEYSGSLYVYRGQSDESWPVQCSALRRIQRESSSISLKHYHIMLLAKAKMRKPQWLTSNETTDLSLLIELQHYGAATMLIDFTYDSLLALYFASADTSSNHGSVFCFELLKARHLSKIEEEYAIDQLFDLCDKSISLVNPHYSNDRIVKQSSVMLLETTGTISDGHLSHKIIIDNQYKKNVLKELKTILYVDDISVYPDFVGYAKANSVICALDGFTELNKYSDPEIKNKEDYLKRLLAIAPYSYVFWIEMGALKLNNDDEDAATTCFFNAVHLSPNDCEIPLNIYDICAKHESYKLALLFNDRAFETGTIKIQHLYRIAENYLNGLRYNSAIKVCKKIILTDSNDISNNLLGRALMGSWQETENPDDIRYAVKCFKASIEDNPDNSDYWFNLGKCYDESGDYHKALPFYLHAYEQEAKPEYIYNIGVMYNLLGKYEKADVFLRMRYKIGQDDFLTTYYLGVNNCYLGRYKKSEYYLIKSRRMEPDDFDVIDALWIFRSN